MKLAPGLRAPVPSAAVAGALAAALLLWPRTVEACAGCRNPTLAGSRGSEGPLAGGALRAGASLTATTIHVVHEAGCADTTTCTETPVQPLYLHDQRMYPLELRVAGEYAFTETLGLELQAPFRAIPTTIEYTTPDGEPYEPLDPGVHHRDETVVGPGDPWLLLQLSLKVEAWWLAARPGLSFPLGRTEEDPFELGDRGLRHQHVQLGSGTFDPVGIVDATGPLGPLELDLFAQAQAALYDNSHGYRAPIRAYGGAALAYWLATDLRGSLGLDVLHEGAERWNGQVKQDGNLGRSELLAAVALAHRLGATRLNLGLRFPLVRHIVQGEDDQGTLSSPVTISLGATHVFETAPSARN